MSKLQQALVQKVQGIKAKTDQPAQQEPNVNNIPHIQHTQIIKYSNITRPQKATQQFSDEESRNLKMIEQKLKDHFINLKPKLLLPRDVKDDYLSEIMKPLLSIPKEDLQKEIKSILIAIEMLINCNGNIEKCDLEVRQSWNKNDQGFNDSQYEFAKQLYGESELAFIGGNYKYKSLSHDQEFKISSLENKEKIDSQFQGTQILPISDVEDDDESVSFDSSPKLLEQQAKKSMGQQLFFSNGNSLIVDQNEFNYFRQNTLFQQEKTPQLKKSGQQDIYQQMLNKKHLEDLEQVDELIKSNQTSINMTHSEYLRALRCLYHDNQRALKSAKDHFQSQMQKLKKAQRYQIANVENFAISAALEKFNEKIEEVQELINSETKSMIIDFRNAQEMIKFYEGEIQQLIKKNMKLERYNSEIISYLYSTIKTRPDYFQQKDDLRMEPMEIINLKYQEMVNCKYLRKTFDFYGMSLRLGAHERTLLAKDEVFVALMKDNEALGHQIDQCHHEIELLKTLLETSHEKEIKLQSDIDSQKEQHNIILQQLNEEIISNKKEISQVQSKYSQKDQELKLYQQFVKLEFTEKQNSYNNCQLELQTTQRQLQLCLHVLETPQKLKIYHHQISQLPNATTSLKEKLSLLESIDLGQIQLEKSAQDEQIDFQNAKLRAEIDRMKRQIARLNQQVNESTVLKKNTGKAKMEEISTEQFYKTSDYNLSQSVNFKTLNDNNGSVSTRVNNASMQSLSQHEQVQNTLKQKKLIKHDFQYHQTSIQSHRNSFNDSYNKLSEQQPLNSERFQIIQEVHLFNPTDDYNLMKKNLPFIISKKEFQVKKPNNLELTMAFQQPGIHHNMKRLSIDQAQQKSTEFYQREFNNQRRLSQMNRTVMNQDKKFKDSIAKIITQEVSIKSESFDMSCEKERSFSTNRVNQFLEAKKLKIGQGSRKRSEGLHSTLNSVLDGNNKAKLPAGIFDSRQIFNFIGRNEFANEGDNPTQNKGEAK